MGQVSTQLQTRIRARTPQHALPVTGIQAHPLQRKCACGGSPGVDGECAACRAKRLSMKRSDTDSPSSSHAIPPIVHEVLSSPGQALDAGTRAFMEPRFGHDFSNVRVHTDTKAAESAQAVNALAFTVGRDVVFGEGQYVPSTGQGRRLIAHELTHTVQQLQNRVTNISMVNTARVSNQRDASEQEANKVADTILSDFSSVGGKIPITNHYVKPIISRTNSSESSSNDALTLPKLEVSSRPPKQKPHLLLPGEQLSLQNSLAQIEWEARPKIQTRYKTWQEYERIRNQVAGWSDPVVGDPDGFIEKAIGQWNANPSIYRYIGEHGNNFDGNPHRSYLNLKRLFQLRGITNLASYFADNIVDITFFNVNTQGHRILRDKLIDAQTALITSGHHYVFDVAGNVPHDEPGSFAFVPRTQNQSINRLSNHALGTAIDLNPRSNPQILRNTGDVQVINAVCGPVLPRGFLVTTDYPTLKRASDYFQVHFNAAWIAQQEQLLNQMQLQHPQPHGLAAQRQLVATIHARRGTLNGYATRGFLNLPQELVSELQRVRLRWGGEYTTSKDFMHFEDLSP